MRLHARSVAALMLALHAGPANSAPAQSAVAAARELYAGAEYDACLTTLESAQVPPGDDVLAGEYRVLCLIGLNRVADATKAVESLLRAEPLYQVPPDTPPRYKTLVETTRRALLPSLARERYGTAKEDFDARLYTAAENGFRTVIALVDDPAIAAEDTATLGDLKTLAGGFLDLIAAQPAPASPAASVPDSAPAPQHEGSAQPAPTSTAMAPASNAVPVITPPVAIVEAFPVWRGTGDRPSPLPFRGKLELVIDERGLVTSARLLQPVHPFYDERLLKAAATWRYRPAERDGKPVSFTKIISIELTAR